MAAEPHPLAPKGAEVASLVTHRHLVLQGSSQVLVAGPIGTQYNLYLQPVIHRLLVLQRGSQVLVAGQADQLYISLHPVIYWLLVLQ